MGKSFWQLGPFLLVLLMAPSCTRRKAQVTDDKSEKVDATAFKVSQLKAKILVASNKKRKVTFNFIKDPAASHAQFVICTVTKPVRCNPSEKVPGVTSVDDYEFLNPPPGELEIKVRACIEAPFALNPDARCGKWKKMTVLTQNIM